MELIVKYDEPKFGYIYIVANNIFFPAYNWDDFYVYILDDWKGIMLENENITFAEFKLYFMDGSYWLVCKKNNSNLTVQGINGKTGDCIFSETIAYSLFKNMVDTAISYLRLNQKQSI